MARLAKASKMLSYILRHKPETIGITLDKEGWASVEELVAKTAHRADIQLTTALIQQVVTSDEKGRYELSEAGDEIRAVQGHSTTQVDITYPEIIPPAILLHGTAEKNRSSITQHGIVSSNRQYVHLSADAGVAYEVGKRHGEPTILVIDTAKVIAAGHKFFLAPNGVWLVDFVPSDCITGCTGHHIVGPFHA